MRCSSCAVGQLWRERSKWLWRKPLPPPLSHAAFSHSCFHFQNIAKGTTNIWTSAHRYISLFAGWLSTWATFYESNMWQNLRLLLISWVMLSWFRIKLKMYTTAWGFQSRPNFRARGDPGPRKQDLGLGGIEVPVCSQQRHGRHLENFATSPLRRRSQVLWDSYQVKQTQPWPSDNIKRFPLKENM